MDRELYIAFNIGNLSKIKKSFETGKVDIEFESQYGFITSCFENRIKIAKYLIKQCEKHNCRIDIHISHNEAYKWACTFKYSALINYLIYLGKHNYIQYNYIINSSSYNLLTIKSIKKDNSLGIIYICNNNITSKLYYFVNIMINYMLWIL